MLKITFKKFLLRVENSNSLTFLVTIKPNWLNEFRRTHHSLLGLTLFCKFPFYADLLSIKSKTSRADQVAYFSI